MRAPLGGAGAFRRSAEARLAQRVGGCGQLALEVKLDGLAIRSALSPAASPR